MVTLQLSTNPLCCWVRAIPQPLESMGYFDGRSIGQWDFRSAEFCQQTGFFTQAVAVSNNKPSYFQHVCFDLTGMYWAEFNCVLIFHRKIFFSTIMTSFFHDYGCRLPLYDHLCTFLLLQPLLKHLSNQVNNFPGFATITNYLKYVVGYVSLPKIRDWSFFNHHYVKQGFLWATWDL